jgi:holdfast attachment protein HfaA
MGCTRLSLTTGLEGDIMTARSVYVTSAAIALLSLTVISPASAQVVRRSSGDGADVMARPYGTTPGEENQPMTGSTRDGNGNRVVVNGMYVNDAYSSQDGLTYGVGRRNSSSGVNASVIGNSLNVVVQGNNNVVVVNSKQDNSGNQTVVLNGGLKLD